MPSLRNQVEGRPLANSADRPAESSVAPLSRVEMNRRDLNEVVHLVLIVGLVVCVTLLLVGLLLGVVGQRSVPDVTLPLGEAIQRALMLRPSGFLSLGLLVLILTPLLRVVGSVLVFIYERDWRFAGITALVLVVMTISILVGHAG